MTDRPPLLDAFLHRGPGYDLTATEREQQLVEAHQVTIGQLRGAEARIRLLEAEVAAARRFAGEMRDFCSPHGVSVHYADQLEAAMDRAKEVQS